MCWIFVPLPCGKCSQELFLILFNGCLIELSLVKRHFPSILDVDTFSYFSGLNRNHISTREHKLFFYIRVDCMGANKYDRCTNPLWSSGSSVTTTEGLISICHVGAV
jgi:hypothetical protein